MKASVDSAGAFKDTLMESRALCKDTLGEIARFFKLAVLTDSVFLHILIAASTKPSWPTAPFPNLYASDMEAAGTREEVTSDTRTHPLGLDSILCQQPLWVMDREQLWDTCRFPLRPDWMIFLAVGNPLTPWAWSSLFPAERKYICKVETSGMA